MALPACTCGVSNWWECYTDPRCRWCNRNRHTTEGTTMPKINVSKLLQRATKAEVGTVQVDIAQASELWAKICYDLWMGDAKYTDFEILECIAATAMRESKRRGKAKREATATAKSGRGAK